MSLNWLQFTAQVRLFLHNYNNVPEIQDLIDLLIPAGVEDLQRTISFYQVGHKDTYAAESLTSQGFIHVGTAPLGRVRSARMVKYEATDALLRPNIFLSLRQVGWNRVPAMRGGELSAFSGMIAIDPVTRAFAVSPPLNSETRLVLEWVGVKSDFEDADDTPFDSRAAEAVGLYVLSKISRTVDRDANQAISYYQSYVQLKRQLLSETRWNSAIDDPIDSQLSGEDTYTESAAVDPMALFNYLPSITSLTGGTAASLDYMATAGVVLNDTVVFVVISGVPQYWRLVLSTEATNIDSGFLRPLDYNASTNARAWSRLS